MEPLAKWENATDAVVLNAARKEIALSHARNCSDAKSASLLAGDPTPEFIAEYIAAELPAVHDPFAGGGSIPLEAQRLGLKAIATDLNPVAVLINKALIDLPVAHQGKPPTNPAARGQLQLKAWRGTEGLAADVAHYGSRMRDEALNRLSDLYKDTQVPPQHGGGTATVIAWIWARTVPSPDPAFSGVEVPLVSNFWLSTKPGQKAWLRPVVDKARQSWAFEVVEGDPSDEKAVSAGTKRGRGDFACLLGGAPIPAAYVRSMGQSGKLGARVIALVADGRKGRLYLPATEHDNALGLAEGIAGDEQDTELPQQALGMRVQNYGLRHHRQLFLPRQLRTLDAFAGLVREVRDTIERDAIEQKRDDARLYAEAVSLYLALSVSKLTVFSTTLARWRAGEGKSAPAFGRQAMPMVWDFAEINPFAGAGGDFGGIVDSASKVLLRLPAKPPGIAEHRSALNAWASSERIILSTDPPYFDNGPYADLADYFYVWLRKMFGRGAFSDLFQTVLTPKAEELIADPFRHGGSDAAKDFFLTGMRQFAQASLAHLDERFPAVFYYAFKQSEVGDDDDDDSENHSSTGWEQFLGALISASYCILGTWPVRTEGATRLRGQGSNALASSIVLACRRRAPDATTVTRGEFRRLLRKELPDALKKLQQGNIAPVDVAQASIGPGMAIFSRHKEVLEADGREMSVRAALQLINEVLDEYLASGEGDFDPDTRFAITWYEQHGWDAGLFGEANTLATARNVSVDGVVAAGICHSVAGKVRILKRLEMRPLEYDPATDERPTIWEFTQHMIRLLETEGEEAAARLLKKLGVAADATRELAYRLYNTCERKKWAEDARSYNGLILAWPELEKLAPRVGDDEPPEKPTKKGGRKTKAPKKGQQKLFPGDEE
jgi:putative DNA methylase